MRFLAPLEKVASRFAPRTSGGDALTPPVSAGDALTPSVASSASSPELATRERPREKARALVHKYAVAGTAWAVLPIPVGTSLGLTAMEAHLIYWIGRIYGEHPTKMDVAMTLGGLELASVALKTAAIEAATAFPVVGWGIKGAIAGSAIEAIGELVIRHYEEKYPDKAA